jgi:hypothetical protein
MKLGKKPKLVRKVDGSSDEGSKARSVADRRRGRPLGVPLPQAGCCSNGGGSSGGSSGAGVAGGTMRESTEGGVRLKADGLTAAQTEKYAAAALAAGVQSQQLQGVQSKLGTAAAFGGSSERFSESSSGGGGEGGGGAPKADLDFSLTGAAVGRGSGNPPKNGGGKLGEESLEDRLLKPLPFSGDPELRALGQTISRDIFQSNPGVAWDDGGWVGMGWAWVGSRVRVSRRERG